MKNRHLPSSLIVLLYRSLQATAGAMTLLFSIANLHRDELGLYQTMVNLASLSMVFEMGLSTALVPMAAALRSQALPHSGSPPLTASSLGHEISALIKSAANWCFKAGTLFLAFIPLGWYFLSDSTTIAVSDWLGPWSLMVCSMALQMPVNALMSGLEGAGHLRWVYTVRLLSVTFGALATWIALALNGKFWAAGLLPLTLLLLQSGALIWSFSGYCKAVLKSPGLPASRWRSEVWPLQWRSAVSWISGYAMMFIHVPLVYHLWGAVEAGRLSVSITIVNTISVVALAYPVSQFPLLVSHVSTRQKSKLDTLFHKIWSASLVLYTLGAIAGGGLVWWLQDTEWSNRLLPLDQLAVLVSAIGLYHAASVMAMYVRAHLQDPVAKLAFLSACLTAVTSVALSSRLGTTGVVWAMLIVNLVIYWPLTMKTRREFKLR